MAKTYYVDAVAGSDSNSGTAVDAALKSLAAVEALKLQPGDKVLFARGSTFTDQLDIKYSGLAGSPITFGAYGEGDNPVITGAARGIHGSKTNWITIEDLTITETTGNAIYAGQASNWVIDDVTIYNAPGGNATGGISFQAGSNLTVTDTAIDRVRSDGIWVDGVSGVVLQGNRIGTVFGGESDNIQVVNSSRVMIRDNELAIGEESDSTKGNLVVNTSLGVTVAENTMVGGGYGASINSNDVAITGNEIYGQGGYTWSFGIGLGERWSVGDYIIDHNHVHDVRWGVAITGIGDTPVIRDNVEVANNIFENNEGAALKLDRPATGSYHDNYVDLDSLVARVVPPAGTGSITDFDLDLLRVQGVDVTAGASIEGKYGTLLVSPEGDLTYLIDPERVAGLKANVVETFNYVANDTRGQSKGQIAVNIDAPPPTSPNPPVAVDDPVYIDLSTGTEASGNILANDYDFDRTPLYLRSIDNVSFATNETTIAGEYGDLHIDRNGDFRYVVDSEKVAGLSGRVTESFFYKISDGALQDTGALAVAIDLGSAVPENDAFGLG